MVQPGDASVLRRGRHCRAAVLYHGCNTLTVAAVPCAVLCDCGSVALSEHYRTATI